MRKILVCSALVAALAVLSAASSLLAEPASIKSGTVALSPQNTLIQFVCAHVGSNPDPRTGHFAKFTGQAQIDEAAKSLRSVSVEIDTNSITTQFDKLTNHLKSPDFFEARQYPTAKFESTKVTPGQNGQAQVTGKLTLHGVTKEISFPATMAVSPSGFTLNSNFSIDRSQFGMNFGPDKVENKVDLKIAVGEKTPAK
jgi:polyisoprenoid-binding protein YceI